MGGTAGSDSSACRHHFNYINLARDAFRYCIKKCRASRGFATEKPAMSAGARDWGASRKDLRGDRSVRQKALAEREGEIVAISQIAHSRDARIYGLKCMLSHAFQQCLAI